MQVQGSFLRGGNRLKISFPASLAPFRKPSEWAFHELVETHQSRVYSIALRMLGDTGIAEEVAQDVFLALYRDLDRMESSEHVLAWLRRVTVHRAMDAHRRRASRPDFAAEEFHDERTVFSAPSAGFPSADAAIGQTRVEQLVASLPAIQKAIVLLRYQEDMLPGEIAAALSMPLGTVKSHLQRALKLLRTKAERQMKEVSHG